MKDHITPVVRILDPILDKQTIRVLHPFAFQYLMPRLHLPYDEYTIPLRCPNHRFRAASAGRPCDHRTDLRASWPLRFCLTPHNDKFEKIVSP